MYSSSAVCFKPTSRLGRLRCDVSLGDITAVQKKKKNCEYPGDGKNNSLVIMKHRFYRVPIDVRR